MVKKITGYAALGAVAFAFVGMIAWAALNSSFVSVEATTSKAPTAQTVSATDVKNTSAIIRGTYNNNGGTDGHVWFEYGTTADASKWPAANKVGVHGINGTNLVNETETLSNLTPNTVYYYKIIAENEDGRAAGSIMSFKTTTTGGTTNPLACANGTTLSLQETQTAQSQGKIKVTLTLTSGVKAVGRIENNTGCALPVSQVTYKMFDQNLGTQEFFDYAPDNGGVATVAAGQTVTLETSLTSCMTQTDVYYGEGPRSLFNDNRFGNITLRYAFDQNNANTYANASGNFCKPAPKPATLKLVKTVVNDNGGTKVVADFKLFQDNTEVTSGQVKTYNFTSTTDNKIITVKENNLPGYTASNWGGDCSADGKVTLRPGDNKTCTITNNDVPPVQVPNASLKLVKTVINDNGGTKQVSDFKLFQNGVEVTSGSAKTYTFARSTDTFDVTVTENNLPGYTASNWGGDCSTDGKITLKPGEHKTCTITNNDVPPTTQYGCIAITKEAYTSNDVRINPTPAFSFKLDNNQTVTTDGNGYATISNVPVGTHTVTEIVPSGWTLVSVSPNNGTVTVGAGSGCANITFKNKQNPPTGGNFGVVCVPNITSGIFLHNPITYTAQATGGNGSYIYSWSGSDGLSGDSSSIVKTYNSKGDKTAIVSVTSNGQTLTAQCVTTVYEPTVCTSNCGGGCTSNCGTTPPVTVTRETGPGQVAGVFLSQVPYTGIGSNMKIALFMLALFSWSAWISYLIIKRKAKKHGVSVAQMFDPSAGSALAFAGGVGTMPKENPFAKLKPQATIPVTTEAPRVEVNAIPHEPKMPEAMVKSPFMEDVEVEETPVVNVPTDATYEKMFAKVNQAPQAQVQTATAEATPKYAPAMTPKKQENQLQVSKPQAQITMPSPTEDIIDSLENRARELNTLVSADGLEIIVKASQNNKHNALIILTHLVELYKGSEHEVDGDWMVLNGEKINKILFSTYITMTPVFIQWLAMGDDKKAMAFVRMLQMQGQTMKDFVMNVVLELDKAYRFRVENMGDADATILDATMNWSNEELESVIHTMVTAVDQTYSSVYSSVKIALVKVLDMSKSKFNA